MRWKCLLCGRKKFTQRDPHKCVGGFRKRGLKWEQIEESEKKPQVCERLPPNDLVVEW